MLPTVIQSAYKHGVKYRDIIHAFNHAIRRFEMDDDFTMVVGGGWDGTVYEIGCVRVATAGVVIVHAMKCRRKFLPLPKGK